MCHGVNIFNSICLKTDDEIGTMSRITYASAIGSIMYGMISTRPDIAFALSVARRYQSNPDTLHWKAVNDILKYLRRTMNLFLVYGSGELKLDGCTYSNFQSDVDDLKSTFGFVFKLNGGAIFWKSSKQDTTVDSTTEAEYIASSAATKDVIWMRNFFQELAIISQIVDLVLVYYDNTGVVVQDKEPRSHQ
ncbi:secreted RxLR effector protein 161-like [Primulina eburnea]|uniref:secreted RxLR effector protein 161-like n=1 Tax=Primulina eburnea TaxID=1245227 RepID=UPI003C6C521D